MSISVITATYNAEKCISRLISSLLLQSDRDFDWIVADGLSTDGTLDLIREARGLNPHIISQQDFGIYDALNRAISVCKTEYYIVVGADDYLNFDAIFNYRAAVSRDNDKKYDIVSAGYRVGKKEFLPMRNRGWLYGMRGYSSSHSVSLMVRTSLHLSNGFYSKSFPICADQLFIGTCLNQGANIKRLNYVAGEYAEGGFSSMDNLGYISELYRVQLKLGESRFLQTVIFLVRLMLNYRKM